VFGEKTGFPHVYISAAHQKGISPNLLEIAVYENLMKRA
jgi:hypothetical protein